MPVEGKRELTRRERRALGITFFTVRRTLSELSAEDPDVLASADRSVLAELVFSRLLDENPEAFAGIDWSTIDWEAVKEFIEWLIKLIMSLFVL